MREPESSSLRLSQVRLVGDVALVAVEHVERHVERHVGRGRFGVGASGSVEPLLVVILDAQGQRALSLDEDARSLEALRRDHPDLDALLDAARDALARSRGARPQGGAHGEAPR